MLELVGAVELEATFVGDVVSLNVSVVESMSVDICPVDVVKTVGSVELEGTLGFIVIDSLVEILSMVVDSKEEVVGIVGSVELKVCFSVSVVLSVFDSVVETMSVDVCSIDNVVKIVGSVEIVCFLLLLVISVTVVFSVNLLVENIVDDDNLSVELEVLLVVDSDGETLSVVVCSLVVCSLVVDCSELEPVEELDTAL